MVDLTHRHRDELLAEFSDLLNRLIEIPWMWEDEADPTEASGCPCFGPLFLLTHHILSEERAHQSRMLFTRLADLEPRRFPQLNGGAVEMVVIAAAAFAGRVSNLFLDEPSSFLHPPQRERLARILRKRSTDCGLLFASHHLEFISIMSEANVYYFSFKREDDHSPGFCTCLHLNPVFKTLDVPRSKKDIAASLTVNESVNSTSMILPLPSDPLISFSPHGTWLSYSAVLRASADFRGNKRRLLP